MDPFSMGLASAGQIVQTGGAIYNNERQGDFAADNRAWQEQMSNTAYQRQMRDMEAAGLNPMLAISSARGASTGSPVMPNTSNPMEGFAGTMNNMARMQAIDLPSLHNQTEVAKATASAKDAEKRNTDADTIIKLSEGSPERQRAVSDQILSDIELKKQHTDTSAAQELNTQAQTEKTRQETAALKAIVPFITRGSNAITELMNWAKAGGKLGDQAADLMEKVKPYTDLISGSPVTTILRLIQENFPAITKTWGSGTPVGTKSPHGPPGSGVPNFNQR